MHQLTAIELQEWKEVDKDFVLIDVREDWEHEAYNIGGFLIPLGTLIGRRNEIPTDKKIVLYCEKGIRSVIAIQRLATYGYANLYNLAGGMKAWKETIK